MKDFKQAIKERMPDFVKRRIVSREDLIRENINKEQIGLEIGPAHHPIASKKAGYHVEVVDWLDQKGLRKQYKEHGVDLDAIEEVDYIWQGGSYYQLIGKKEYYDYIIASHMIEHTTDFLGFLQDCSTMLKPKGSLYLAIPDKRYCFDHFRDITGLAEVLNDSYYHSNLHSVGRVAEYFTYVVKYKEKISWDKRLGLLGTHTISNKNYSYIHSTEVVKDSMRRVLENNEYIDIHHYTFTPASFELLIAELQILELLDLEIVHKYATLGNEFLVTMRKTQEKHAVDYEYRKQLLRKRNRENRI